MAQLITEGHIAAYTYRWHFFLTALKSVSEKRKHRVQDMAIAARASKMEPKDFNKFVDAKPMSHDDIYEKHKADTL